MNYDTGSDAVNVVISDNSFEQQHMMMKAALEKILDICNTDGVDAETKYRGISDVAFDVLDRWWGY